MVLKPPSQSNTTPDLITAADVNRVRLVVDIKDQYYLAAEYIDCQACRGTFIAWDHRMLAQLSDGVRARLPVILTRKYVCDQAVVTLLKDRTLGNSSSAIRNKLLEVHSEEWLRKQVCYLSDCQQHSRGLMDLHLPVPAYKEASPFPSFPTHQWFLAVYS